MARGFGFSLSAFGGFAFTLSLLRGGQSFRLRLLCGKPLLIGLRPASRFQSRLFRGPRSRLLGGVLARDGRLALVFLTLLLLAAKRDYARVLRSERRLPRHCDHGFLAGLLRLISLRLRESVLGLLEAISRVFVGARDPRKLNGVLRFE